MCKSESSKLLFTKEREREGDGMAARGAGHQSISLLSFSVVPGSVCECGVSQLYGPDRESERERGARARSFFKSRVE